MNRTVHDPDGSRESQAHLARLRELGAMCLDMYSHCLCRLDPGHAAEHWCPCGNKWNDEP